MGDVLVVGADDVVECCAKKLDPAAIDDDAVRTQSRRIHALLANVDEDTGAEVAAGHSEKATSHRVVLITQLIRRGPRGTPEKGLEVIRRGKRIVGWLA
jgi:hypothetical protein